jgi:hypothetical protein
MIRISGRTPTVSLSTSAAQGSLRAFSVFSSNECCARMLAVVPRAQLINSLTWIGPLWAANVRGSQRGHGSRRWRFNPDVGQPGQIGREPPADFAPLVR